MGKTCLYYIAGIVVFAYFSLHGLGHTCDIIVMIKVSMTRCIQFNTKSNREIDSIQTMYSQEVVLCVHRQTYVQQEGKVIVQYDTIDCVT